MNKDIQTLIEREAEEKYLILDDEGFLDFSDEEKLKAFKVGAHFALSLFKWRKVSEELPKMETVLIRVMCHYPNGNHEIIVTTGTILSVDKCNLDNEFIEEVARSYKATEWMPIPQVD